MPRISKRDLIKTVIRALRANGWRANLLSGQDEHPARLEISRGDKNSRVRLYIWNLTHGGATRSDSEFRIQITSGVRSFTTEEGSKTVILGWSTQFGVFAGFDFEHRNGNLGSSPSIQISKATLEGAQLRGIAYQDKGGGELAVAVRADSLGSYLSDPDAIHSGQSATSERLAPTTSDIGRFLRAREEVQHQYGFGLPVDLRGREEILDRIEVVERELHRLRHASHDRSHNNPPELLPENEASVLKSVDDAASAIRGELSKPSPNVPDISRKARVLNGIAESMKSVATKVKEKAEDYVSEAIGGAMLAIIALAPTFIDLIVRLIGEIVKWLQLLF